MVRALVTGVGGGGYATASASEGRRPCAWRHGAILLRSTYPRSFLWQVLVFDILHFLVVNNPRYFFVVVSRVRGRALLASRGARAGPATKSMFRPSHALCPRTIFFWRRSFSAAVGDAGWRRHSPFNCRILFSCVHDGILLSTAWATDEETHETHSHRARFPCTEPVSVCLRGTLCGVVPRLLPCVAYFFTRHRLGATLCSSLSRRAFTASARFNTKDGYSDAQTRRFLSPPQQCVAVFVLARMLKPARPISFRAQLSAEAGVNGCPRATRLNKTMAIIPGA